MSQLNVLSPTGDLTEPTLEVRSVDAPSEGVPPVDVLLQAMAEELVMSLAGDDGPRLPDAEMRRRMRPWLGRLRELHCPPERMVVQIKQLLVTVRRPASRAHSLEWMMFTQRRDAVVAIAIEEYFSVV